jgi:hypothetical protein
MMWTIASGGLVALTFAMGVLAGFSAVAVVQDLRLS